VYNSEEREDKYKLEVCQGIGYEFERILLEENCDREMQLFLIYVASRRSNNHL
jgi:hypothetical protein